MITWLKNALLGIVLFSLPLHAETTLHINKNSAKEITATWKIDDDSYIIINKSSFRLTNNPNEKPTIQCPEGETYHDSFFGDIKIAKGQLQCVLLLSKPYSEEVTIASTVQICKLNGGCVAPLSQRATTKGGTVDIAATSSLSKPKKTSGILGNLLGGASLSVDEPLPVDEAFEFLPPLLDNDGIDINWNIADKHYLYKHTFKFALSENKNLKLGEANIPKGEPKTDQFFGDIEVYHKNINITVPVTNSADTAQTANLEVTYQGCAERGICYPPTKKLVKLEIPANTVSVMATAVTDMADGNTENPSNTNTNKSKANFNLNQQEDRLLGALQSGNIFLILAAFFGAGLLLAFTPCVFPMVPILSGIITGQGGEVTTKKAFTLSLVYVLAMAFVYTLIGVASGIIGESIQAWFQKPWVLLSFGAIIAFMALSMFGLFSLQMPQSVQSKASDISNQQKSGSLVGVAVMGMLSALIVGACSTPVLAVAIGYIGKTADPILGGMGLFAMSIGMGLPLLLIGTSAGKLLPKQGMWMDTVKYAFGVLMLAVALYIIDPVVPRSIMMGLWATLLIGCGVYMGGASNAQTGWQKFFKSLGIVAIAYGIIMLVGMATGKGGLLSPLKGLGGGAATVAEEHLQFTRIRGVEELDKKLALAKQNKQMVMMDFYADWCKSCLELEEFTFSNPQVKKSLEGVMLLQADVTLNDATDKALLKRFGINGPPAILFFDKNSAEKRDYRLNGFFKPEDFSRHVKAAFNN